MSKIGRNQPCPCGSGVKAKRCCGVPRGPSPDQLATAWLARQARQWAPMLLEHTDEEFEALFDQAANLAALDLSLHLALPRMLPPALEQLRHAVTDHDPDAAVAAIADALEGIDTPTTRQRLARAVLDLHDHGHHIPCDLAAYAIIDLAELHEPSVVLFGSLLHTLEVATGTSPTPSGLLVAAR